MTLPGSEVIKVSDIPNAGRGIIASRPISKNTLLIRSNPPVAHVIFREYRKEVCAQCFLYDRGRTLPIRHNDTGKVFCTSDCEDRWLEEEGELGLPAWQALQAFIQSRSKAMNNHNVLLLEDKPDQETMQNAWTKADERSRKIRESKRKPNARTQPPRSVDPDVLSYLLSGILFFYRHAEKWNEDVLNLAVGPTPYRDSLDLEAHCNSFVQLAFFLPPELSSCCTSELCQALVSATSHNSFGIRSGSDEGEEYMGYALYPDASYFNHSCSANVVKKRIGSVWEFRAAKDIGEGEQCCITYLGGDEYDLTVIARRARLKVHWGFECMCERCLKENSE